MPGVFPAALLGIVLCSLGTAHLSALLAPAALGAAAASVVAVSLFDVRSVFALLGFAASLWLGIASVSILLKRGLNFASAGMALAHLGVAVSILGATASGALQREALVSVRVGDIVEMGPWRTELVDVRPVAGPNWTALEAELRVTRNGRDAAVLHPQARTFVMPPMETTEAGLVGLWRGDLYAVLGKPDGSGKWQLHIWFKPLVRLIWLGALLMALGGLIALGGKFKVRIGGRRRREPSGTLAPAE
jgi:cytochrome c-type biogenesis protein CcmF